MGIIVLHSAYVSLLVFLLLDKGPSMAKACLGCKEGNKTSGGHVTAHLYENCVVLFSVVLCSCYRICLWCFREESDRE